VDYLAFETRLAHTNAQRTATNRVYVQVHNRGIQPAAAVTVKLLYAAASPTLPDLPLDFWTAFPGNGTTTNWVPIGSAQTIASISPTRPEILEWDWAPPSSLPDHTCLLIVADCPTDPIPAANKIFSVGTLVAAEKHVGLKNLHLINALPAPSWHGLNVNLVRASDVLRMVGAPPGWSIGVLPPKAVALKATGLATGKLTQAQTAALQKNLGAAYKLYNPAQVRTFAPRTATAALTGFSSAAKNMSLMLLFTASKQAKPGSVTIVAESAGKVVGGNTFVLVP